MTNRQLGVGVIGYGYWGPNLVRNFSNGISTHVVSICDLDPGKLATSQRLYPGVTTTSDFHDLLTNPAIDAIAIATPTRTHYDLALAALKAGKHVFVEKPLAPTAEQVRSLIDEANRRNLILMVDHTFLYTPAVQKIRELVHTGELGEIYYYDSIRSSLGLFQSDVNVIWDLAVHDISIINYIIKEKPVSVSATASRHVDGSPENMAHITLFFDSKCVAHVSVNWLSPIKVRQTFIGGSRTMIVYDDVEPTEKIKVYDKGIILNSSSENTHDIARATCGLLIFQPLKRFKPRLSISPIASSIIRCRSRALRRDWKSSRFSKPRRDRSPNKVVRSALDSPLHFEKVPRVSV